jgi:hypothetical protein
MKLTLQSGESWQYQLNQPEADILLGLMKKFPFTELGPVQFSKTDADPKTAERKKLLAESLAQHREELKGLAVNLLGADKWQKSDSGRLLTLNTEGREILLQILNDIRIGCWHALGEPEPLEQPAASGQQFAHRQLMDLAGYFEMNLLEPEA